MIEVQVKYYKKLIGNKKKNTSGEKTEMFVVTSFLVQGHANDGSHLAMKCCAGVTAILTGFTRLVNKYFATCELDRGYFSYKYWGLPVSDDYDMLFGINCVWCQLYDIYKMYPQFFTKFEMIEEVKESNYGKRKKQKSC